MSDLLIDFALLVAFLAVLVRSALFAVESITKFSKIVGISELAVGFFIVALSTSMPEITVAIFSVQSDNVGITLGDIFGSNVTNIALITALFMLLSPIKLIKKKTILSLSPLLIICSIIPLLLLLVNEGSWLVGVMLLVLFGVFAYRMIHSNQKEYVEPKVSGSALKQFLFFAVGMILVIVSAKIIVDSVSSIAYQTGIRQSVLGATIVALGTSLPELTVDIVAVRRRHLDLALGDIIGSSITNIALILGIVLVFSQLTINFGVLSTLMAFVVITHITMFLFLRSGKIAKWQSVFLFAIYAAFLITIYEIQITIGGLKFL